jgi:hypothetical protein
MSAAIEAMSAAHKWSTASLQAQLAKLFGLAPPHALSMAGERPARLAS